MLDKNKNRKLSARKIDTYLHCFGGYSSSDIICRKKCVLSIKCLMEQKRYLDLIFSGDLFENDEENEIIQ